MLSEHSSGLGMLNPILHGKKLEAKEVKHGPQYTAINWQDSAQA